MEHCIYHSRDLDGLTSGAVIYSHQKSFGEDCNLVGYDYGEKLDTRKFKGKTTCMIDVSMPMDRMETLGNGCMEFIWIDHHISALDQLKKYCEEKSYQIKESKINGLITCYEVNKMNMIYYFSDKLSGCEIASALYGRGLKTESKKLVQILGQYDTWRNSSEKMFTNDSDWNEVVMPIQYAMRLNTTPKQVYEVFEQIDWSGYQLSIEELKMIGRSILLYKKQQNKTLCEKSLFEFEMKGLKVVALNTTGFNSLSFEGFYWPEIHDVMMPFSYNGKSEMWNFSMYTTKEEIDILSIAKDFGGGGHKMACGFQLPSEQVRFTKNGIEFGPAIILDVNMLPENFEMKPKEIIEVLKAQPFIPIINEKKGAEINQVKK